MVVQDEANDESVALGVDAGVHGTKDIDNTSIELKKKKTTTSKKSTISLTLANVQLVGSEGTGKTTLGEALVEFASQYTLEM